MKRQLRHLVSEITGYDRKKTDSIILSGKVLVDEKVSSKPGELFNDNSLIRIKEINEFVSRGAYKLLKGVEVFKPDLEGRVCIDGGSSTGGFTQILLKFGSKLVYAVDCGFNQLDYSLRINKSVISMEGKRVQDINKGDLNPPPDFAAADISFSSCLPVLAHFFNTLNINEALILLKPQFEYDRLKTVLGLSSDFSGVVKNQSDRIAIKEYLLEEIKALNIEIAGEIESPIKGTNGNIEYITYLKRI